MIYDIASLHAIPQMGFVLQKGLDDIFVLGQIDIKMNKRMKCVVKRTFLNQLRKDFICISD